MFEHVERKGPVVVDALAFSAHPLRGLRFHVDVLPRRKARAGDDEAIAVERDQFDRDRTGTIVRDDRIRNNAGEGGYLMVLGGDGDPPCGTARIGAGIEFDSVETLSGTGLVGYREDARGIGR